MADKNYSDSMGVRIPTTATSGWTAQDIYDYQLRKNNGTWSAGGTTLNAYNSSLKCVCPLTANGLDIKGDEQFRNFTGVTFGTDGASFNGSSQWLDMLVSLNLVPSAKFAISMQCKFNAVTNGDGEFVPLHIYNNSDSEALQFGIYGASQTTETRFKQSNGSSIHPTDTAMSLSTSVSYHFVLIAEGTNFYQYKDGTELSHASYDNTVFTFSRIRLGARFAGTYLTNGYIKNFMFWKDATISDASAFATALYNSGSPAVWSP